MITAGKRGVMIMSLSEKFGKSISSMREKVVAMNGPVEGISLMPAVEPVRVEEIAVQSSKVVPISRGNSERVNK